MLLYSYASVYPSRHTGHDKEAIEIGGRNLMRVPSIDPDMQLSKRIKLDGDTDSDEQGLKRQVSQNLRSKSHSPRNINPKY